MNHRFIINIDLPEGVLIHATNRPLTRDQIEAAATAALREELIAFCRLDTLQPSKMGICTEAAPAREEGGAK